MIGAGGAGGPERRGQPAQARARARRAAHDRRHDLGRVQEVLREGRRARAPLPGRSRSRSPARTRPSTMMRGLRREARGAPRRAHPRRGGRRRRCGSRSRYISGRQLPDKAVERARHAPARASRSASSATPAGDRGRRAAASTTLDARDRSRSSASSATGARSRGAARRARRRERARPSDELADARGSAGEQETELVDEIRELRAASSRRDAEAPTTSATPPREPSVERRSSTSSPRAAGRGAARCRPTSTRQAVARGDRRLDRHPRRQDGRATRSTRVLELEDAARASA